MQIVIDVPEEMYQSVLNGTYCGTLYEELKTGTPLPKGHGRLIDADAIDLSKYNRFCDAINGTPTIIEADKEVEHDT